MRNLLNKIEEISVQIAGHPQQAFRIRDALIGMWNEAIDEGIKECGEDDSVPAPVIKAVLKCKKLP